MVLYRISFTISCNLLEFFSAVFLRPFYPVGLTSLVVRQEQDLVNMKVACYLGGTGSLGILNLSNVSVAFSERDASEVAVGG